MDDDGMSWWGALARVSGLMAVVCGIMAAAAWVGGVYGFRAALVALALLVIPPAATVLWLVHRP